MKILGFINLEIVFQSLPAFIVRCIQFLSIISNYDVYKVGSGIIT